MYEYVYAQYLGFGFGFRSDTGIWLIFAAMMKSFSVRPPAKDKAGPIQSLHVIILQEKY